ncbi:MAG: sugar transferase [Ignavibacteriae bacterium]|nr:sugar transferase [Ignavibacteriota bacterium]
MANRKERWILLFADFLAISLAWTVYYTLRVRSGWIDLSVEPDFWTPMIFVYLFWAIVFFMVGLYRSWYAASRFDEIALLFKSTLMGCLFLFFVIFVDDQGQNVAVSSRLLIAIYWGILFSFVSVGRLAFRSVQRRMLIAGIGAHNTIIVGSPSKSRELYNEVVKYPALGYRVVGFAGVDNRKAGAYKGLKVFGIVDDLHKIIEKHDIREVLIALDSSDHDRLLEIIRRCNSHKVGLKIMPDLYDIISGQARTNQIYGFPLIEISPELMRPWEESLKRLLDISVSLAVLALGLPLWVLIATIIKLESPGPVLYKQERVGKDGERFNIVKFRSMREDAEKAGPQWAGKKDPRVTQVGKILRKLHLDEIPQMWNVLLGHMSLVGPRPERPMFVEKLSREIPMYPRRLKVRPGITGWAQVKHKYDETIEDVKKKVQYDLFYIENMSLRMDTKIILSTIYHMLLGRGR